MFGAPMTQTSLRGLNHASARSITVTRPRPFVVGLVALRTPGRLMLHYRLLLHLAKIVSHLRWPLALLTPFAPTALTSRSSSPKRNTQYDTLRTSAL